MIPILNAVAALLTIAFGAFGLLAPRYTLGALELATTTSPFGLSEIRASVGGGFVAIGLYCLIAGTTQTYFTLGILYAGLTLGRFASLAMDNPPLQKTLLFGGIELVIAAYLITTNA